MPIRLSHCGFQLHKHFETTNDHRTGVTYIVINLGYYTPILFKDEHEYLNFFVKDEYW